jgi:hypothetical protein
MADSALLLAAFVHVIGAPTNHFLHEVNIYSENNGGRTNFPDPVNLITTDPAAKAPAQKR